MTHPTRIILATLFMLLSWMQSAYSRELFEGSKPPVFTPGQLIQAGDQMGGYPIYLGNESWNLIDAQVTRSGGSAESIPIGHLQVALWRDGLAAIQTVTANVGRNVSSHWTGEPCAGESLAKRNRARGRNDDCMRIQPESIPVNGKPETFLFVLTVQSQSDGRFYASNLGFNVKHLGFPGTTVAQWSASSVQSDAAKVAALTKLTRWAELYQDGALTLMNYRRPNDAFAAVPALREVMALKPAAIAAPGKTYTFCESTRTMVVDVEGSCPPSPTPNQQ